MKTYLQSAQPLLTVVRLLLAEGQLDQVTLTMLNGAKGNHVLVHSIEVLSRVFIFARTQTLRRLNE